MSAIAKPEVVSRDEWVATRKAHLAKEKEWTRATDRLHAERRRLPMVKLEKEYSFDSPEGKKSLGDLFDGQKQLIVYHFMFDPKWDKGCPGCTGMIDTLGDISMLGERNTAFTLISRAPLEKLEKYKAERGWDRPWVSSFDTDFNYDFYATMDSEVAPDKIAEWDQLGFYKRDPDWPAPKGEQHGYSVFFKDDEGAIYLTYSSYARGVESVNDSYTMLDITPYGRQEDWEDSPEGWPQKPTYG